MVSRLGTAPTTGPAVISEERNGEDGTIVEQHQTADGRVGQNSAQVHQFDDGWRVVMDDPKLLSAIGETLNPGSIHPERTRDGQ